MSFYAYHGANQEERVLGQPFVVDLEVELNLSKPGRTDELKDTVSYTDLYRVVKEVMEGTPHNLLESLAEEIARGTLSSYAVEAVRVRVAKTRPPIKGATLSSAAVEIYRKRLR